MKNWHCLLLVCAGCGTDTGAGTEVDAGTDDGGIDTPGELSKLESCLSEGGTLTELWAVNNQHGPVTSIVAGSLVVLGGQDGSVKQWSIDGDEPAYGTPFTTAGSPVVALALSSDAHVLAATQQGTVPAWRLSDASATDTTTIVDAQLSALAVSPDATRLVVGTATGQLFDATRETGAKEQLESSLWGVDAIAFAAGDRLYTAGHWYGTPQIERRVAATPIYVIDEWNDQARNGHVRAVAANAEASLLVAAGDGFVATFAPDDLAAGPRVIADAADHTAVGAVLLPGGALFVTAGSEGTLRVWNAETAAHVATLQIAAPIGLAADTDGTRLFTSGADGRLHAFGCTP